MDVTNGTFVVGCSVVVLDHSHPESERAHGDLPLRSSISQLDLNRLL